MKKRQFPHRSLIPTNPIKGGLDLLAKNRERETVEKPSKHYLNQVLKVLPSVMSRGYHILLDRM